MTAAVVLLVAVSAPAEPRMPTKEERAEAIRRAHVWEPGDVAARDLYNGPKGKLDVPVDQEVACDFVPTLMAGLTEKFLCKLEDGRTFKVKYDDSPRFKEAVGEVLGTRMLWALGFYADTMRPVRVTCRGCPRHPWTWIREDKNKKRLDENGEPGPLPPEAEAGTWTFDPAAIEERLDVTTIEREKDQGWWWKEIREVDEAAGGSSRAEVDALKLLMAFLQNSDNKSRQNAIACPRGSQAVDGAAPAACPRPIMYVDDAGSVFGKGGFVTRNAGRVDFDGWKKRRIWKSATSCRAQLKGIGGILRPSNLRNPKVGEAGRRLLASELESLADHQIEDLFRAARIDRLRQTTDA